jgi:hypothetical protein
LVLKKIIFHVKLWVQVGLVNPVNFLSTNLNTNVYIS